MRIYRQNNAIHLDNGTEYSLVRACDLVVELTLGGLLFKNKGVSLFGGAAFFYSEIQDENSTLTNASYEDAQDYLNTVLTKDC